MHIETYCCFLSSGLAEYGFTFKEYEGAESEFDMPLGKALPEEFDTVADAAWTKFRGEAERIARDPSQLDAWLSEHSRH